GVVVLIQGVGRPDVPAKFHLLELPIYGAMLWYLLPRYGVAGAAIAWSVRTIGDTIVLMISCPILLPASRGVVLRMGAWLAAASVVLVTGGLVSGSAQRFILVGVAIPAWMYLCWRVLITPAERAMPVRSLIAVLRPE
ncbi:MAG TPA: hypothetical protein VF483_00225, partial [Gemmatimonadaceae bacterium]